MCGANRWRTYLPAQNLERRARVDDGDVGDSSTGGSRPAAETGGRNRIRTVLEQFRSKPASGTRHIFLRRRSRRLFHPSTPVQPRESHDLVSPRFATLAIVRSSPLAQFAGSASAQGVVVVSLRALVSHRSRSPTACTRSSPPRSAPDSSRATRSRSSATMACSCSTPATFPASTRRQIAEIRKLTDKPVRYVVNSHWHPDHNLGNSDYRAEFPGVRSSARRPRAPAFSSACPRTSDR